MMMMMMMHDMSCNGADSDGGEYYDCEDGGSDGDVVMMVILLHVTCDGGEDQ
jgi:hypothetical protein